MIEQILDAAESISVICASIAAVLGINAWKREHVWKRKAELAERTLATFYEVRDSIAMIRSPFGTVGEGASRQRDPSESPDESDLLDRGYVVFERYKRKESVFAEFEKLKYQFMATFGKQHEEIFKSTFVLTNKIFASARTLATYYWKRQGRVPMDAKESDEHFEGMRRHEAIFWDDSSDDDPLRKELSEIQEKLESAVKPLLMQQPDGT